MIDRSCRNAVTGRSGRDPAWRPESGRFAAKRRQAGTAVPDPASSRPSLRVFEVRVTMYRSGFPSHVSGAKLYIYSLPGTPIMSPTPAGAAAERSYDPPHTTGADPDRPGREALGLTVGNRPKSPLLRTISRLGRLRFRSISPRARVDGRLTTGRYSGDLGNRVFMLPILIRPGGFRSRAMHVRKQFPGGQRLYFLPNAVESIQENGQ
jgi:hypothetical protein